MWCTSDRQIDKQTDDRMAVTGKSWFKGLFTAIQKIDKQEVEDNGQDRLSTSFEKNQEKQSYNKQMPKIIKKK